MIRHLLTLIWNQRKQNGWLFADLVLVLLSVFFLVDAAVPYTLSRWAIEVGISLVLLAVMLVLGIAIPAFKVFQEEPAEALRYEE